MATRVETKEVIIDGKKFVNSEEAAKALGFSITHLRDMARAGSIPCLKVGSRWRYNVADVFNRLEKHVQLNALRVAPKVEEDICDGI